MLDLENLPDRGPAASVNKGGNTANTGLDFLPDTYEGTLRGLYRQNTSLPDVYAKNKKLSTVTGAPVIDAVRNPFTPEMQANEPDWKNVSNRSPKAAKALSENVDLFHMGKDDTDNLSWWEAGLRKAEKALKYVVSAPDAKRSLASDIESGIRTFSRGMQDKKVADAFQILDTIKKIESGELKSDTDILRYSEYGALFVGVGREKRALELTKKQYERQLADATLASLQQTKALRNKALMPSDELNRVAAAEGFTELLSATASNPEVVVEVAARSIGTLVPALPFIVATARSRGGAGLSGATGISSALAEYTTSFNEVFQEMKIDINDVESARAAISSPEFKQRMADKAKKSGVIGLFDAATAGLASKMLAPRQLAGRTLTAGQRAGANIAAQTTVQAAGGAGGEALGSLAGGEEIKPGAVWMEAIAEAPGGVIDVFTLNAADATKDAIRVQDAIASADKLGEMMKRATESKLRTRAPETFAQFVQEMADSDGDSISTVYIDAETLSDVLQQANISEGELLGQLPSLLPQYQDAIDTKSTVSIPIGELLTNVAGTDLEPLLLPHLRESDDINALSRAEAEQASKKAQEYLQQMAEFVVQEANNAEQLRASSEVVRNNILTQFTQANRFTADVNESYANMARDFYTVLANDLKITPEQLWAGGWTDANGNVQAPFQLQIRAEGVEGPALNQPINEALQARIDADYAGVVAEYNALEEAKGGQVINTDIARELSPEYRADRSRAAEVHDAASAFTKRLYADRLAAPVMPGKVPVVVFTAGGTGAGKSSVAAVTGPMMDTADIVYDTTMSTFKSSDEKIQQALASGRSVTIAYVYRDPVDALVNGALPRAMNSGRTAPLKVLQESHTGSRKVIQQLAEKYAGDERVTIFAIDNSLGRGNARLVSLDKIPEVSENGLEEKLNEALENAYAAGAITEQVYRGTTNRPLSQGVGQGAGRGVGGRAEQLAEPAGDGGRRQEGGALAPLAGAPRIEGATGPDPSLVAVAEKYAADNGITLRRQSEYVEVDPARAARIAQAYDEMPHAPQDPAVQEAYADLIAQTLAQYKALEEAGYTFWFYDQNNDPYQGNPWNAMRDLRQNKSMAVFATDAGYGSALTPSDVEGNPMLADTGLTWPVGSPTGERKPVLANDLFRAVHDAFGHGLEGAGFRAQGEENAWQAHVRLFTGPAVAAITTETRGQNSWLNYGPYGAANQKAKVEDTVFAEQKTGLMPEWTWTEGVAGDMSLGRADVTEQNTLREKVDAALDTQIAPSPDAYSQAAPAASVTGYHFSNQQRTNLDGRFYGTGLKGQERDRLARATDSRIKDRVYFYVDEGKGVTPEQGVGPIAHSAELSNLYDVMADPLRLWDGDHNASESRILDAGFDGYYARGVFGTQGVAVVLGAASQGITVQPLDKAPARATGGSAAPQAPFRYGLMGDEIAAVNANIEAVRAVAPSAAVRSGNLVIDRAELEAARPVLAGIGVQLPGGTLAQPARGTFSPSQLRIDVLKDADLSTVIHEMGHFFLEGMARFAAMPGAPARVAEDLDTAFRWFKLPGATAAERLAHWNGLTLDERRPYHEKWAESFEQYAFEGQPPVPEMRPLFQRFREFMLAAYQSIERFTKQYGFQLTDEVRAVFNRMLATKAEIETAEQSVGYAPLYATKPDGMSDAEWADYQAQTAAGTQTAIDTLQARSLRDLKWTVNARSRILKQLQRDVETKRKAMREEVTAEVREMPVYAAQRFLKKGELPDGTKVEGGKLSLPILKELYGEEPAALWRYLATNMVTADAESGLHPNMVAELFGFKNGDEMVRAIVGSDKETDMIDGLTDQRLLERYGDLVTERGINEAADRAVHNEARARAVATEMRFAEEALGRTEKTERGGYVNVALRAAKEYAAAMVARRRVRDLRPGQHTAAEKRAAKKAADAQKKGDNLEVVTAKRDQLLNHYASRATLDALSEIERKVDYLRKFEKESVRKNLPADYLAQIDALLERFDLRRGTTLRALERRAALRDWVEKQQELGNNPVIPDELLDEAYRTSYKEMTVEEFRALVDTVRNIEHLGKLKDKLLTLQDNRAFAAVVQEVERSIRDNATKETPVRIDAPTKLQRGADAVRGFFSSHRKLSSLIRQMDGFKEGGAFWSVFVRSMNRAGDMEATMRQEATQKLAAIFEPLLKTGKMRQQVTIPAINASLSLETRLVIALNWGNEANQQRVMDGDKWSRQQVEAILGTLTPEQLGFVQQAWDLIDSYWPAIKAKEERVSGVAPEKVDAVPFEITASDGTVVQMQGGYYPIKYDPDRSSKAEADTEAEVTKQMMQGQYTRATTRRGHTKARAETVNRAIRKDIGVMFQHINEVIHDLSWHEWLIDATRLLRAEPIDAAIRETAGPVILRELKKAVTDIAAGEVPAQTEIERGLNYLRNGVTVIGMGWNLMTSLMQPLGLTQSMVRIGPKWIGKGMARWIGGSVKMEGVVADVYAKSDFMRLRGDTMQREINEIRNKVAGEKFTALQESYFYLIQKGQMIADLPTWLGMYERVMEETDGDEGMAVALADQAVRDAQGAGQVADLARIQRGGPLLKLFTNFYSYFNTTFNLTAERYGATNFKNPLQVGRFAVDMLMLYVVPTVLAFSLKEAVKGGDDDEEELLQKLAKEQLSYLLGTVVGLREVGAAITGFNGYQGPAGTRFFSEVGKLAKQVEQGEIDIALIKAMNNTAGILLHYPAGAVNRAVEGFIALQEGKTNNPLVILTGPPKE